MSQTTNDWEGGDRTPNWWTVPIHSRWKVVKGIGRGGQAGVFLAHDLALDGRRVAVKVFGGTTVPPARIKREAELLARIDDPHLVRILGAGWCPFWGPFLVTEWVKGPNLKELIAECNRRNMPLALGAAVLIHLAVARALVVLHAKRIVHRDIKPSNIVVTKSLTPHAKVIDLGVAKWLPGDDLTADGATIGTPKYMAPEVAAGKRATVSADVYGLALCLWESLAGHHPLDGRFAARIIPVRAVRPETPQELSDLIADCLVRAPRQRPRATEVVSRLELLRDRLRC